MNLEKLKNLVNSVSKAILLILAFATPLFFLPQTVDILEFPKQILIWAAVLFLTLLAILKSYLEGEVKILKTPLSYSIFLFLLVYLLSSFISENRADSFLGFFGRANSGFLAVFSYLAIFYFVTYYFENLKEIVAALWAVILGILVLSILAIFYYFGVFLIPIQFAKINSFSPVGGFLVLSQILGAAIPLILGMIVHFTFQEIKFLSEKQKIIGSNLLLLIIIFTLILTNTITGWVGLGVGLVVFAALIPKEQVKKLALGFLLVAVILIILGIATQAPFVRNRFSPLDIDLAKPQSLSLPISWIVAAETVRDYPLFGSGPASFISDFTTYRPVQLNLTDAWNLRFVQGGSLYLDLLATTGILGLATFLYILSRFFQYILQNFAFWVKQPIFPLKLGLISAVVAFLVSFLTYSFSTSALFIFWFLVGLIFALEKISGSTQIVEIKFKTVQAFSFLVILAIAALLGFWATLRLFISNTSYRAAASALIRNDLDKGEKLLLEAAKQNPLQDTYYLDLARVNFFKALTILQSKEISQPERQEAVKSLNLAIANAQKATNLAPGKVVNWEVLGDIYSAFAGQITGSADLAISAYSRAIFLDPPNPNLWLKASNLLARIGNLDQVIETAKQAVRVKPNLIDARIFLARALGLKADFEAAKNQFEIAKTLTQTLEDSETKNRLLQQIDQGLTIIREKQATPAAIPQPGPL